MKTYALIAGIDDYNKVRKLRGCVNDIEKVGKYLTGNYADIETKKLLNEHATKQAIVEAFTNIQHNIAAKDTFLFYFCGHGTQEPADEIWNATNGKLASIVCYDEDFDKPYSYLLADKELRFLIYELSKTNCHIVTIFDCCHSGGNTRNFDPVFKAYDKADVRERHYHSPKFSPRPWHQFIFGSSIDPDKIIGKLVNEFLPQGKHVQLAACESNESSIEVNGEGVFTKTLLKVLEETAGKINYYDLKGRIRQYLRFVYEQQPRIYTIGANDEEARQLLFTRFMNDQTADLQLFNAEVIYNVSKGWLLNFGAIHGVNKDTTIDLVDPLVPGKYFRLEIKSVFIDHTILWTTANVPVPPEYKACKARIEGLKFSELTLHIKKHHEKLVQLKSLADALLNNTAGYFILTEDEISADYVLHVWPASIYLTHPQDTFRPLVQPVDIYPGNGRVPQSWTANIQKLIAYLKDISRWNYTKQLQNNSGDNFYKEPVMMDISEVSQAGGEKFVRINNESPGTGTVVLSGDSGNRLRIRLTNQTGQNIFVAAAYLSQDFQVFTDLLERKVELLEPGKFTHLSLRSRRGYGVKNNDLIDLQLPDVIREYNWPEYTETLKIITSSKEFNVEALSLTALPAAYTLKDKVPATRDRGAETDRGFDFDKDKPVILSGWATQTVNIKYPNIFYNKVEQKKIEELLDWDKTAFFAKELYGDGQGGDNSIT